ncbi:uncharacterized protein LOC111243123 [Varroa destructor]|uniref:Gustatory receptor n=1 Tax=Varroa destructor TaxID=109461 RepID=A0A7M7JB38_VARDE|nr:uncharacterized protein LOC111243123 [Varroa destructor]
MGRNRTKISPKLVYYNTISSPLSPARSGLIATNATGAFRSKTTQRVCLVGFKKLSDFHRLYVCSFLRIDITHPAESEESHWFFVRFWSVWMMAVLALYLGTVLMDETLRSLSPRGQFNFIIFALLIYSTHMEAFVIANLMRVCRKKWVEIIADCERLEERMVATSSMAQSMRSSAQFILYIQWLIIAFNFGINIINDFGMGMWNHYNIKMTVHMQATCYIFSFIGGLMIPSNATVARVWMMYFGRLFRTYIQQIAKLLREVLDSNDTLEAKVIAIDDLRVQLNHVRVIAEKLSKVLGVGILFGYGYTIPLLCIGGYFVTMPSMRFRVRAYFAAFAFAHIVSILVPVVIVAQLSRGIADLKRMIEEMSVRNAPPLLRTHLALLDRAVLTEDFRIDARGFFKADLDMFINIMGASVTYTVVLSQAHNRMFDEQTSDMSLLEV